jgi:predicted DsbA family dithiol-disulfide isomerase
MSTPIRVDFISDIVCPWCAIGLGALEQAIQRLADEIVVEINFEPFELNPDMPHGGQNAVEHIMQKYGSTATDIDRGQQSIRSGGNSVGFHFDFDKRTHFYNTFDAHRLMFWAGFEGLQRPLSHALFGAYFTHGQDISSHQTLARIASSVGLSAERAYEVLSSNLYANEVREREFYFTSRAIHSVPVVVLNGRQVITGAQTADYYEQSLRKIAAQI